MVETQTGIKTHSKYFTKLTILTVINVC